MFSVLWLCEPLYIGPWGSHQAEIDESPAMTTVASGFRQPQSGCESNGFFDICSASSGLLAKHLSKDGEHLHPFEGDEGLMNGSWLLGLSTFV